MSSVPKVLKRSMDVVFWVFLITTVLVAGLATYAVFRGTVDANMTVPISLVPDTAVVQVESDVYGSAELMVLTGFATFEEIGSPQHVVSVLLMAAVFVVATLWILQLLRRIFGAVAAGEPFTAGNAQRIRLLGVLVIAAEAIGQTVVFLLQRAVMEGATATGATLSANFTLNPITILLGLLIIALAEAFRHGADLQAEADLTV
jgi:hypothetical protein